MPAKKKPARKRSPKRKPAAAPREETPFDEDFTRTVKGDEREALVVIAERLTKERPLPRPALRSEIRSRLLGGRRRPAPRAVGRLIAGYAGAGVLLLAVAALGVAGAGPFAA